MNPAAISWSMDPVLFSIGPLTVVWYGVLFAGAFLIGNKMMEWIFQREGRPMVQLESLFMYMIIGTMVGARLGHCLFYQPEYYLSNPLKILFVWEGGLASHGGALGILLSIFLYCRKTGQRYLCMLDRLVIPIMLGGMMIRIGNFFNSEIVGTPSTLPWAVVFERRLQELGREARHPAQLYEAFAYIGAKPGRNSIRAFR